MLARAFLEPQQGATYGDQLAAALAAEAAGFDAFFRSDHYQAFGGDGRPGPTDAWVTLAGLARETSTIRLGTMVTSATFRRVGALAITVAQVDAMSAGRVELGLGAGWFDAEHRACGIPFPPTGERFDHLEDQLAVLTGLWTTPVGERFSYSGRTLSVADSPGLPKPVQQPWPPIIVGGAGTRRTPDLAARFADEFNLPFHPLEAARPAFDRVRSACEAAGRDPTSIRMSAALTVCCGATQAEIDRRAAVIGRPVDRIDLAGTPGSILDRLGQWSAAGASTVYLQLLDHGDLDHIRLLGEEVVPALAGLV